MTSIVHVGLGPLGQKTVRFALERGFRMIGAVDPAPDKTGKDLGELCGVAKLGITVRKSLAEALQGQKPDVAVVTTVSSLAKLEPQVLEIAKYRIPVVSTCEELSFPWKTQPEIASRIDHAFKEAGVGCIGTGVNPGFLMDHLPTALTAVCQKVDAVRVWRFQDASVRRIPFQEKIGAGLTIDEFARKRADGSLRHVGLAESLDLIASRMGWQLSRTKESLEPIIAETEITTGYKPIAKGMARGVEQVARGYMGEREVILLHFRASVGENDPHDTIEIRGEPNLRSTIPGGVQGDIATCAITLNSIRSILESGAGLKTMCDVTPVAYSCRTKSDRLTR